METTRKLWDMYWTRSIITGGQWSSKRNSLLCKFQTDLTIGKPVDVELGDGITLSKLQLYILFDSLKNPMSCCAKPVTDPRQDRKIASMLDRWSFTAATMLPLALFPHRL